MWTHLPALFARPFETTSEDFYRKAFEVLASGDPDDRAMVENLMWDHRVSPIRAGSLHSVVQYEASLLRQRNQASSDIEAIALKRGLKHYFRSKVRIQAVPEFCIPEHNSGNILKHPELGCKIDPNLLLARIVNLNKLREVFLNAKADPNLKHLSCFRRRPGKPGPAQINKWLDVALSRGRGMTEQEHVQMKEDFVADLITILNRSVGDRLAGDKPYDAFEPTWATHWDELRPHVADGPVRWSQVIGVCHSGLTDLWLLVLVYPVSDVSILVRPTQLDADWYGRHYPSPPQAELIKGGHPMDLRYEPPAVGLRTEYIHLQIEHRIDDYYRGGRLLEKMTEPAAHDLDRERTQHGILLTRTYELSTPV